MCSPEWHASHIWFVLIPLLIKSSQLLSVQKIKWRESLVSSPQPQNQRRTEPQYIAPTWIVILIIMAGFEWTLCSKTYRILCASLIFHLLLSVPTTSSAKLIGGIEDEVTWMKSHHRMTYSKEARIIGGSLVSLCSVHATDASFNIAYIVIDKLTCNPLQQRRQTTDIHIQCPCMSMDDLVALVLSLAKTQCLPPREFIASKSSFVPSFHTLSLISFMCFK